MHSFEEKTFGLVWNATTSRKKASERAKFLSSESKAHFEEWKTEMKIVLRTCKVILFLFAFVVMWIHCHAPTPTHKGVSLSLIDICTESFLAYHSIFGVERERKHFAGEQKKKNCE